MTAAEILLYLKKHGSSAAVDRMKYFGIASPKAFGVPAPVLRKLAKEMGTDQPLALNLWKSGYHEARIVAACIADPDRMTQQHMDRWASDFDSWAVCDACCAELFCYTPFAIPTIRRWTKHKKEFVKRAGFVLMATLAVHRKELSDDVFRSFFPMIILESHDERNFVRKAVNWALRQIGKKNPALNTEAVRIARQLSAGKTAAARWIGNDALKDLGSEATKRKFARMKERTSP